MTSAEQLRAALKIVREDQRARRIARKERAQAAIQKIHHERVMPTAKGQRQPRVRDKDYLAWVAGLPCVACYVRTGRFAFGVHVAHVRMSDSKAGWVNPGLQRKPSDDRTAPLCPTHHLVDQHGQAERDFWNSLGINAPDFCRDLHAAYLAGQDGSAVIISHGRKAA